MKLNKELAYNIIAKEFYDCKYNGLKRKHQEVVEEWFDDRKDIMYEFWKKGSKVWREG